MPVDPHPAVLVTPRLLLLPLTRGAMVARVELEALPGDHVLVEVLMPAVGEGQVTETSPAPGDSGVAHQPPQRLERDETWQRRELLLPRSWPGDPLPMFPDRISAMSGDDDEREGSWIVIARDSLTVPGEPAFAVGMIGTVGPPTPDGFQEIGYGMNPESWGRGFATESVGAVVDELLHRPDISIVLAYTAVGNIASQRVLEHNHFRQVGTDWNEDDGDLLVWNRVESPTT